MPPDNDNGYHPGGTPTTRMFQHLHSREGGNGAALADTVANTVIGVLTEADPVGGAIAGGAYAVAKSLAERRKDKDD
jgi:hypothetical protein